MTPDRLRYPGTGFSHNDAVWHHADIGDPRPGEKGPLFVSPLLASLAFVNTQNIYMGERKRAVAAGYLDHPRVQSVLADYEALMGEMSFGDAVDLTSGASYE